ncbi:hypothetical protein N9V54_02915 [Planktomarina temperata]|nr:hypothetical protein [Planktomarina temperata]
MWRAKKHNIIIYREFWIPHLIFLSILNTQNKIVYFNINHELNSLQYRKIRKFIVHLFMKKCQYLLLLEGKEHLVSAPLNQHLKVLPFSVVPISKKITTYPITIGVAGAIRSEKGIESTLDEVKKINLTSFQTQVKFQVGSPNIDIALLQKKFPTFNYIDTSSDHSYHAFLKNCDVIIFNFEHFDYNLRHSGVLIDAISHQCVPIVPKLPLMTSLVTCPTPIGVVREDGQSLEDAIAKAISLVQEIEKHQTWELFFSQRKPYTTLD